MVHETLAKVNTKESHKEEHEEKDGQNDSNWRGGHML